MDCLEDPLPREIQRQISVDAAIAGAACSSEQQHIDPDPELM